MALRCLLALACCACGRVGLDTPATPDAPVAPQLCAPSMVFDFTASLAQSDQAVAARVAPFGSGFVLGVGTQQLDIFALHLAADLSAAETSPHLPLVGAYTLWSAYGSTADAFFWIGDSDGTGYLKRLENNFDTYLAVQQDGRYPVAPPLAALGSAYLLGAVGLNGALDMYTVDATGASESPELTVAYTPTGSAASVVAIADGVLAAIAASPCETFTIDATGVTAAHQTFAAACATPELANDASALVYTEGGMVLGYDLATQVTTMLGAGSDAHVARAGSTLWAAWLDGGTVMLRAGSDLATGVTTPTTLTAATVALAVTAAGAQPVWLAGNQVWQGQGCTP